jgi:transglutaminase-like putative cysteine protease
MNYRLTITAAVAVILASFSLFTVIEGSGWLYEGAGAVIVVAAAGLATRLSPVRAAAVAAGLCLVAIVPLLAWTSWTARIAGLVLLAAVAGSAAWRKILPAVADAVTYLAALLIYLNLVYAGRQSLARIVPTVTSMRQLAHVASLGYAEHTFAPPVPDIRGIQLIATAGIGAIAILVDLLAVRARAPAVAGLPLLVLFSVPVATNVKHAGLGLTLAFCLGITGYLALLAADGRERLRLWGRLVTVWQSAPGEEAAHGPDIRELAASGRRIGLAAVALAVVVPLVLPGLKEHGIFGKDAAPGHGSGQVTPPQPLVQMRSQLLSHSAQPYLTYRINGLTGAFDPSQQYLQVYVLNYDNSSGSWTLATRNPSSTVGSQGLLPAPGLSPDTGFATSRSIITISKSAGHSGQLSYLPLPYAPQFLSVPGADWLESNSTLMVYGFRPEAGLTYRITSKIAQPTQAQLSTTAAIPASIKHAYLGYAGPDRPQLQEIARQITAGTHNRFQEAVALENYFTKPGNFTYDLRDTPPSSVLQFLTTTRRGFCQQFAFAMAVLARLIGLPARIAVGYTAGTPTGRHTWKVTTADAHAWPELYFPGAGWIRFEPTPGGPGAQGTATRPTYAAPAPAGAPSAGPTVGPTGPAVAPSAGTSGALPRIRPPTAGDKAAGGPGGSARSGGFPVALVVLLVLVLLLVAPGLIRAATRRRRWHAASHDAGRAHAAWRELTSDLTDHGLGGQPSESPRASASRITAAASLDPAAREAIGRIAAAEEKARYARLPGGGDTLRADTAIVRRALARNASWVQRWRARLMPASTLAPVLSALRQAPDTFGWLDAAGLRMRHKLGHALQARRTG